MTALGTEVRHDCRVAFATELVALAEKDERIVAVCNDSVGSSNLAEFRDRFPERLINVGIAEQNMVGVGAGLAAQGLVPFVCGAAPFLTGRALEQIKVDVAYSGQPVVLCGMSPGLAYGELGPTHHSIEDLSWLRALPGLDIVIPADGPQTVRAVRLAVEDPRPRYLRIGRFPVPTIGGEANSLARGRFNELRDGRDVALIAVGTMVSRALAAADRLERMGVSASVVNAAYLAPLDEGYLTALAARVGGIVTAEEANIAGGLGAAVASHLGQLRTGRRTPLRILGAHGFAPTGSTEFLLEHFGLSIDALVVASQEVIADAGAL